jgi:hypothetical protein
MMLIREKKIKMRKKRKQNSLRAVFLIYYVLFLFQ